MSKRLAFSVARTYLASALVAAALLATLGCGSAEPFSYVPVSGRVVYDDGTPLPATVRVAFVSQAPVADGKYHPRNAYAFTDQDGYFQAVTSRKYGDGIVAGKNKVLIILEAPNPTSVVPSIYADVETTPLEVDAADAPFEFRIHKPG